MNHRDFDVTDTEHLKPRATPPPSVAALDAASECASCGEETPVNECPKSQRPCGHHCNHVWTHDSCCWCEKEFGDE